MSFDPEAVRKFERTGWNRAATAYEATFAHSSRQFVEPLLDAALGTRGQRVLDLACDGPGVVVGAAAGRGATVTGLDFSEPMLTIARARYPAIKFAVPIAASVACCIKG